MARKKPVWGMILDATSSIDDLFATLDKEMKSYGKFDFWHESYSSPNPIGSTDTRVRDEWQTYSAYRRTSADEDRYDDYDVHGIRTQATEPTDGQPETLTYRAKLIETTGSGGYHYEWKLLKKQSKVGMVELVDRSETGTTLTRDALWTATPSKGNTVFYGDKTKKNLLNHLGKDFDAADERAHVFLITGDKQIELGDRNDAVSTFFPGHYRENNGHFPEDTDRSPTGRYTGGSDIDGGGGFDRLIYDDGDFYFSFKEMHRVDKQKFLRKDFEISVDGNPLDHAFKITNTKYGWTDRITGIEELEFARPTSATITGTGSVTVDIAAAFTRGDDRFDFNGKLTDLEQKATFGMTFSRAGGGDDHVWLPSQFAVLRDGPLDAKGKSNNFRAGNGDDVIYGGSRQDFIRGGTGDDVINGDSDARTGGPDKLFGGAGHDVLSGGKRNDWLRGGKGDDVLWGGDGKDFMQGGKGKDELTGDGGKDKLQGGKGSDTFVFTHNFGRDKILDFQATGPRRQQDHIEFHKLVDEAGTFREFKAASIQDGRNVIYDAHDDGINKIVLRNVDLNDLSPFNFDYV